MIPGLGRSPGKGNRLATPVFLGFACGLAGKESTCNAGDLGSIPGLGRSPGEGKGYPLQYSGLENSMDCIAHGVSKSRTGLSDFCFTFMHWRRQWQPTPVFLPGESQGGGAWWAAVSGVAQSRTRLKRLSSGSSRSFLPVANACPCDIFT